MGIELKLIVLLSFVIHVFLFFAGRFHLCFSDKFIRSIFGLAYLGANLVAVYALGTLPRQDQDGSTNSIAFLWAPFFLIHLGGNDTITAWTLEDNNLWLRSWCNLVLHVVLVGYAFWKSIGRHSVDLLVSAIFVFVTGIIKYGERAWCLKAGSMESIENSTGRHHYEIELPEDESQAPNNPTYSDTIREDLCSMCEVHDIFAAHNVLTSSQDEYDVAREIIQEYGTDLARIAFRDATTQPTESGDANVVQPSGDADDVQVSGDANAVQLSGDADDVQVSGDANVVQVSGESRDANVVQVSGESRDVDAIQVSGDANIVQLSEESGDVDAIQLSGDANVAQVSGDTNAIHIPISDEAPRRGRDRRKVVELQLGMMHDDLYTKALFLRTRAGFVLRVMSVVSALVAIGLFIASDKKRYNKDDIAISYSLFIGVFFLELCSMVILMMSPWTWAWFESHGLSMPAKISWLLLTSRIGWPEARPRWPTSMGQYNIMHMLVMGMHKTRSLTPRAMVQCRRLMNMFGFGKEPISWLSNLIHTEYVTVDKRVMEHVLRGFQSLCDEFVLAGLELDNQRRTGLLLSDDELTMTAGFDKVARRWRHLGSFLEFIQNVFIQDFGTALLMLHTVTDVYMSQYPRPMTQQEDELGEVCTRLSNYMMYLMVNHPSSLPLNVSAIASLEKTKATFSEAIDRGRTSEERYNNIKAELLVGDQPTGEDALTEMIDMWTRVLLFAAGRSKAEHHAAHLARGGELITTAWLHMANRGYGDSKYKRIRINNYDPVVGRDDLKEAYAFYFPRPSRNPRPLPRLRKGWKSWSSI